MNADESITEAAVLIWKAGGEMRPGGASVDGDHWRLMVDSAGDTADETLWTLEVMLLMFLESCSREFL